MQRTSAAPRGRNTIFFRILIGYVTVALVALAVTGSISALLIRRHITTNNLTDLLERAKAVSMSLGQSDGQVKQISKWGLAEMEALCDARLIYVGPDMVARQMPVKAKGADASVPAEQAPPDQTPAPTAAPDADESTARFKKHNARPYPALTQRMQQVYGALFPLPNDENSELLRFNVYGSVDEQLIRSIMNGEESTDVRQLQFVSYPVMFAGVPLADYETGEVSAAIILCRPLTEVGEATNMILLMLVLAGLAALALAVVLAWFMSRRITRPIQALSTIAGRMTEGHYDERFTMVQRDEIGQLGGTLNTLAARLDEVIGKLEDEKRRLEMVLSSIGEGIIAIDKAGRVIHANAAALNILNLRAWDVDPENPDSLVKQRALIDMLKRSMHEGERIVTGWQTIEGRAIEAIASPVKGADEVITGAVCLVRDVSESQKIEQMRRDYIANISHELRTPLTGIRGMVEPLMDGIMETEQEKAESYLVIYQETVRLEKLIGEMLDMSRLQSGKIELELEPIPPRGLLEAAVRRMQPRADESGVTLALNIPDDPLTLMGHEDRIVQVLIILMDNALSFTPPGGTVTAFARREPDGRVALGVKDTGAGIDPVDLPYIWERFYKADRSRMRTSGTGLGLAIAKLVVELMHGEIDVKTELGRGAVFTFVLNAG